MSKREGRKGLMALSVLEPMRSINQQRVCTDSFPVECQATDVYENTTHKS